MKARVAGATELIWNGRLHLGDEPGVYGDASYVGLVVEWPLTLTPFDANEPADVSLQLDATEVHVYAPYPGHLLSVFAYEPIAGTTPPQWSKRLLVQARLSTNELVVPVPQQASLKYVGARLEVDTTVAPGLYDDFVVLSISLISTTHSADFGFRYP